MNKTDVPAVEAEQLRKSFGDLYAVDGIDLTVPAGMVYGVLGPNGAGKTTLIRILATLMRPDSGHARIFGHDVVADADAVRSRISLTGQYASVDEDLTGRENLVLVARLLGYRWSQAAARADELLESFGLSDAARRPAGKYSGGMRRRLDIAAGLVVPPSLVFLDEPTTGLDPYSRHQVWQIVRTLVAAGTTVLLTTQYLDEADQLAERIAVINHGTVIAEGTPADLKASVGAGILRIRVADPARRAAAAQLLADKFNLTVHLEAEPTSLSAPVGGTAHATRALDELSDADIALTDLTLGQPSLDEVFLTLTGHPTDDAAPDDVHTAKEPAA